MHNFDCVPKKKAAPVKRKLIELIRAVQDEVRDCFRFRFVFVGSSKRNMITWEPNGNIGFDFDVNIEPNDPDEEYDAGEIRKIIFAAFQKHMGRFGYNKIEDSTSVITIKAIDCWGSRIKHSCDIAIVRWKDKRRQLIEFYKSYMSIYRWTDRRDESEIDEKYEWLWEKGYELELRKRYLEYKNYNDDPDKHSRSLFAQAVNDLYHKYRNER